MSFPSEITILGGRGMLGTDLAEACNNKGIKANVLDLPEFDITDEEQLGRAVKSNGLIVNCAAYTNVDGAESEPDLAYRINGRAVGQLGEFAEKAGAYVMHISTDFVFDGSSDGPYIETDTTNPISVYGSSKLAGEQLLAESGCSYSIIRIQWTYGKNGNNFVKKMLELAKAGRSLKVIDDQIGSPTATTEVSEAICVLLSKEQLPQGIFHFAANGFVSRYEMARFIFEKCGLNIDMTSCKTSDYTTPAARPLSSRFDCSKIQRLLEEPIKNWSVPLEQFLEQL